MGKYITVGNLNSTLGLNSIYGDDTKDIITVTGTMFTSNNTSSTLINVFDGNDTIRVNGMMYGYGENTIQGGNGNKDLQVLGGMYSAGYANVNGAYNTVQFGNGNHKMTYGQVYSLFGGQNRIATGTGIDDIKFNSLFFAAKDGHNVVELGDGDKHLTFALGINSEFNGINAISLGEGQHILNVTGSLISNFDGLTSISSVSGNTLMTISSMMYACGGFNDINVGDVSQATDVHAFSMRTMESYSNGVNSIQVNGGNANIGISGLMQASGAQNHIHTDNGSDVVSVGGMYTSSGTNTIETGSNAVVAPGVTVGNDTVIVNGDMTAIVGDNYIATGAGDDLVKVKGVVYGCANGTNVISTGDGNDTIALNGTVIEGGLSINAGEGYDILNLTGIKLWGLDTFTGYQAWMTDLAKAGGLATATGLEEIAINLNGNTAFEADWLSNLINENNALNPDHTIELGVNIDSLSNVINAKNILSSAGSSDISSIDMSGGHVNTLQVIGSLLSNGHQGDLRISGDSSDIVQLDSTWVDTATTSTHANGTVYEVYTNSAHENLLIEAGMNIAHFYA